MLPLNPLLKKGEIAFHLKDAGAKILLATVVFQAESEPGAAEAGVEYLPVPLPAGDTDVPRLTDLAKEHEPLAGPHAALARRPRRPALHERHHRHAEGRDADARQPALERVPREPPGRPARADRRRRRRAAAVPRVRPVGRPERRAAVRRHARATAALRRRAGARPDRAAERDGLPGRPDDVHGDAARRVRRQARPVEAAPVRVRRRGDPRRGDPRVRGEVRGTHPRGLRPVGDVADRVVQPPGPAEQAGLDRHADLGRRVPPARRRRQRAGAGRARRDPDPRALRDARLPRQARGDREGHRRRRLVQHRATSRPSTRTATTSSSTARRT